MTLQPDIEDFPPTEISQGNRHFVVVHRNKNAGRCLSGEGWYWWEMDNIGFRAGPINGPFSTQADAMTAFKSHVKPN